MQDLGSAQAGGSSSGVPAALGSQKRQKVQQPLTAPRAAAATSSQPSLHLAAATQGTSVEPSSSAAPGGLFTGQAVAGVVTASQAAAAAAAEAVAAASAAVATGASPAASDPSLQVAAAAADERGGLSQAAQQASELAPMNEMGCAVGQAIVSESEPDQALRLFGGKRQNSQEPGPEADSLLTGGIQPSGAKSQKRG